MTGETSVLFLNHVFLLLQQAGLARRLVGLLPAIVYLRHGRPGPSLSGIIEGIGAQKGIKLLPVLVHVLRQVGLLKSHAGHKLSDFGLRPCEFFLLEV